jgi:hypothetical protein
MTQPRMVLYIFFAPRIGFLDVDEYFVPVDPTMSVGAVLAQYRGEPAASVQFNRLVRMLCVIVYHADQHKTGLRTCSTRLVVPFHGQFFGPNGHKTRPDASVLSSYTTHVNPFTRLHQDLRLHRGKSFFRTGMCATVRIHACEMAVNASVHVAPAISAHKVRATRCPPCRAYVGVIRSICDGRIPTLCHSLLGSNIQWGVPIGGGAIVCSTAHMSVSA